MSKNMLTILIYLFFCVRKKLLDSQWSKSNKSVKIFVKIIGRYGSWSI
jgi:hypothetical protein